MRARWNEPARRLLSSVVRKVLMSWRGRRSAFSPLRAASGDSFVALSRVGRFEVEVIVSVRIKVLRRRRHPITLLIE